VHEVGHQLGANHTFSMSLEGTGQNKEIGSGITIMGYAGITSYDVAPHSIDIYHETSIAQIQANLANKTCPVTTDITANNVAPVIGPVSNYTIPISTPFALTASATDANGDPLTYCWEQNDNSTTSNSGSVASPTKTTGPNWLSFSPTASATRLFPKLSTILAGSNVTGPLPGGDAGVNIEALSSVSRTLNFRLTVRDNHVFSQTSPVSVGQTAFTDVVVTVTNTAGPFQVTAPNTNVTWNAGSTATVTWSVNSTNTGSVNCSSVNILLSTDGGNTFPTVLASATPNDGSQVVTVPSMQGTNNRIKVEAVGNIFFDISNTNFTISSPPPCTDPTGLVSSNITQTAATLNWNHDASATSHDVDYKATSSSTWINARTATTFDSVNLSGLAAGTTYDWRVRTHCAAGTGNYVQAQFTTTAPTNTCPGTYDISTNGTRSGAATIPLNTDVKGLINPKNDNDYYGFVISTGGTITLSLKTLPADYQLDVLDANGVTLGSSTTNGTADETINATVGQGTFYARVYPRNAGQSNASNCYTLRVQTGTASKVIADAMQQSLKTRLAVSPNPARNIANVVFNTNTGGHATLSVMDQSGALVLSKTIVTNKGDNRNTLDISRFESGTYFIKIQTGSFVQTATLAVVK